MKSLPLFSLAAVLFSAPFVVADDKVEIKPEWLIGKTYLQTLLTEQITAVPGQGEALVNTTMTMSMAASPGKKEGTKNLKVVYEDMQISMKVGGKEMPKQDAMSALKNFTFTVIMDSDGLIKGVEDLNELKKKNPQVAAFINEDQVKNMLSQANLYALPKNAVGKGDSWEYKMTVPMPGLNGGLAGTYAHGGEETIDGAKCVAIKMKGSFSLESGGKEEGKEETTEQQQMRKAMEQMGLKVKAADIAGTLYYDAAQKLVVKSVTDMKMHLSMKNPASGELMEMPVQTKMTTKMEIKPGK